MKTAIVIPVHNAYEYTKRCLEQISQTVPQGVPLILVEDDCDEETSELLYWYRADRLQPNEETQEIDEERPITLLVNSQQQLFTRSANRGIRYAYRHYGAEAILAVNTDCDLRLGWYEYLISGLETLDGAGIIGFRDQPDAKEFSRRTYTPVYHPSYVTGHCLAYRTAMLEEVGVLCETDLDGRADPVLKPYHGQAHIGSERIHGWKAMAMGWRSYYCNAPAVYHEAGKSWGHRLGWLNAFMLQPLWEPSDTLERPLWIYDPPLDPPYLPAHVD